jgi:hypothetical protein
LNQIAKSFKFMRDKLKPKLPHEKDKENWETYNKLSEVEKKIYTRISIDLAKSLHNILVILQKEKK